MVKGDAVQDSVIRFARYFREAKIPCDVLGLEPGWQTATYSCSYLWNEERFPDHKEMLNKLNSLGYKLIFGNMLYTSNLTYSRGYDAICWRFFSLEWFGS